MHFKPCASHGLVASRGSATSGWYSLNPCPMSAVLFGTSWLQKKSQKSHFYSVIALTLVLFHTTGSIVSPPCFWNNQIQTFSVCNLHSSQGRLPWVGWSFQTGSRESVKKTREPGWCNTPKHEWLWLVAKKQNVQKNHVLSG